MSDVIQCIEGSFAFFDATIDSNYYHNNQQTADVLVLGRKFFYFSTKIHTYIQQQCIYVSLKFIIKSGGHILF